MSVVNWRDEELIIKDMDEQMRLHTLFHLAIQVRDMEMKLENFTDKKTWASRGAVLLRVDRL